MEKTQRPEGCTDEHLFYLDNLQELGITNMFGARPYLIEEFGLNKKLAGGILCYWMQLRSGSLKKEIQSVRETYYADKE